MQATIATAPITKAALANVTGSNGSTPKSIRSSKGVSASSAA